MRVTDDPTDNVMNPGSNGSGSPREADRYQRGDSSSGGWTYSISRPKRRERCSPSFLCRTESPLRANAQSYFAH